MRKGKGRQSEGCGGGGGEGGKLGKGCGEDITGCMGGGMRRPSMILCWCVSRERPWEAHNYSHVVCHPTHDWQVVQWKWIGA